MSPTRNKRICELMKEEINSSENWCNWTNNTTKNTKEILSFLQDNFKEQENWHQNLIELYECVKKQSLIWKNPKLSNKVMRIFLNYLKKLFFRNKNFPTKLIDKLRGDSYFTEWIIAYSKHINSKIMDCNNEPYEEISYLLFLFGEESNFNLINDLRSGMGWIKKLLNNKILGIEKNGKLLQLKEYLQLIDTLNKLTIINSVNTEERGIWKSLFNIISSSVKSLLLWIIKNISEDTYKILLFDPYVNYLVETEKRLKLSPEQKTQISKLQDMLWKIYANFSANLDNTETDTKRYENPELSDTMQFSTEQKIDYGFELRQTSNFWERKWVILEKERKEAVMVKDWNKAYVSLLKIKNGKDNWYVNIDREEIVLDWLKQLILIYNKCNKDELNNFNTRLDVINHFIWTIWENIGIFQIIVVYKLMLFFDFDNKTVSNLIRNLINNKEWNIVFEKYKILLLELVLTKYSNNLKICEPEECLAEKCKNENEANKICDKVICEIEDYIKSNSKYNLIYNFWKLYLSLALLYSAWKTKESQEKAKKYYLTFLEKYWNYIPEDSTELVKQIKINIWMIELENSFNIPSSMVTPENLQSKWESEIKEYKEKFSLIERQKLQEKISDIILEIQKRDSEIDWVDFVNIEREIWNSVAWILFHNLCKVRIELKAKKWKIWRFEKEERIENWFFSIAFIYHDIYEKTFKYIFEQEKNYIKEEVEKLIDIYQNHVRLSKSYKTLSIMVSDIMEKKDAYTNWHINRVKDYTNEIWKRLWYSLAKRNTLEVKAILHDYWKNRIDDEILKKPSYLTPEEKIIINSHTGNGIIKWVNKWMDILLLRWMIHHSNFYSPDWDSSLTLDDLIKKCNEWKKVDPLDFNKLIWRNIPESSRVIRIADTIDAIVSRRIYDGRAWLNIWEIIDIVNKELISCSWLIKYWEKTELALDKWDIINEKEENKLCYSIKWNWLFYKPKKEITIQFDPTIIIKFIDIIEATDNLKKLMITNDKNDILNKLSEFNENITLLKDKKDQLEEALKKNKEVWEQIIFTKEDEQNLQRLRDSHEKILAISFEYENGEKN
ncbi:MAG: metal dependent phosphohydrolase [uncultured bacterium (gcode 4)]|uniref:Metal dependent phosphohydrolase n=1 Tax=uncultured bacterium (gcode 4) TaxID=1234023 RepID=K2AVZ1_9BACT|nr:MAG: metal dependent phosphohydrolase [uncultured bacterium (gcode 4)]